MSGFENSAVNADSADPGGEEAAVGATKAITRVPVPDLCCLWAETPTAPMNIALIGVFDGDPLTGPGGQVQIATIRSFIAAHLGHAPMLRRVLLPTRPGQGRMAWTDAQHLDIDDHVVLAGPGRPFTSEGDFLDWCARRSVIPLDHTRPLWRMDVIPALLGGQVGLLVVMHHVVADGLRGVATIGALLDPAPDGVDSAEPRWVPEPPPTATELITDNLRNRVSTIRQIRPAHVPQRLRMLRAVSREQARHAPPTCLTGPIGPARRLLVLRQPLEELRAWGHATGCTINDLLLAAVTAGLRAMLCERGQCPDGLVLRASVPVGARPGNPGGMIVVPLPVGTADPTQRLRFISAATRRRKQHPGEGIAGIVAMPASLARLGVAWARHAAPTHINLYVSNVPGPPIPLYLAGARLLKAIPVAPLVANVRLSVTALSYDGALSIAVLADEAITDLPTMTARMRAALAPASSQQQSAGQPLRAG
jgi:diacylglycerol O-acyltransferase / wax synthase